MVYLQVDAVTEVRAISYATNCTTECTSAIVPRVSSSTKMDTAVKVSVVFRYLRRPTAI